MTTRNELFIELPSSAPGTTRVLKMIEYGDPAVRPKVYIQAALHADEVPGILVQHYLAGLLDEANAAGSIKGHIILVPVANPLGSDQRIYGDMIGRYHFADGVNFNRKHADLTNAVAESVGGSLTGDVEANAKRVRQALVTAANGLPGVDDGAVLKRTLLAQAMDADICLDLHCDNEAVLHMYTLSASWPDAEDLARQLGCRGVFIVDESGGDPFDEAVSTPWLKLAQRFPEVPLPPPPLSATIELRGLADVDADIARQDAQNLFAFLVRRGVIEGSPGALPAPLCEATPTAGIDHVRTDCAGVVMHCKQPGDQAVAGEVVARVLDPYSPFGDGISEFTAAADGMVYARTHHRMVAPGQILIDIACPEELPSRAGTTLLSD